MICLLTDFGTRDGYVGAMKGVIASRCDAAIYDITHDIEPFAIAGAAWILGSVWKYWPEQTIFVAIVDPGVGTTRAILAGERDGRFFLAPDNGLLTFVAPPRVFTVTDESLFLPHGSTTFHGRDRFAPVAAALANGLALEKLGAEAGSILRIDYEPPDYGEERAKGTVVSIDRFGNCITDLEPSKIAFPRPAAVFGEREIATIRETYAGAEEGEPFLIVGSAGTLEISVANGDAAALLGVRRGDCVRLRRT